MNLNPSTPRDERALASSRRLIERYRQQDQEQGRTSCLLRGVMISLQVRPSARNFAAIRTALVEPVAILNEGAIEDVIEPFNRVRDVYTALGAPAYCDARRSLVAELAATRPIARLVQTATANDRSEGRHAA